MIDVEGLTKLYGPRTVVDTLTFHVEKGDIVGFLGPNGAGKTTTMRMLTGYLPPSDGRASIAGFDTFGQSLDARKHIGYLPETVPLYTEMAVADYLDFMGALRQVPHRRAAVQRAMEATHIEDRAQQNIGKLSKGYRQRVGLAQAILHEPDVLILDEPTIGLDPRQIIEIRNLIKSLGVKQTVILSTHILPEVSMTCDRVIIIHEGKLVAVDTPANLIKRLQEVPTILVKAEGPAREIADAISGIAGVLSVKEARSSSYEAPGFQVETRKEEFVLNDLARTIYERGWQLKEIRPVDMTLEEIFIKLVTREDQT